MVKWREIDPTPLLTVQLYSPKSDSSVNWMFSMELAKGESCAECELGGTPQV